MKQNKIIPLIIMIIILVAIGLGYYIYTKNNNKSNLENQQTEISKTQTSSNDINKKETTSSNAKILVAYYSLTGTTEKVANKIQEKTNADIFKITPVNAYPTDHDECSKIAQKEKEQNARPELATHVENMENYDIVFIGYPIWWYTAPMMIRTFVEEYDFSNKIIVPFCTSWGAGVEESENDIKELAPNANVLDGIQLGSMSDSQLDSRIERWFNSIELNDKINELNKNNQNQTSQISETTNVILTINGTDIPAVLNSSKSAKDLISRLPVTLHLSRGSRDYCGGITPALEYDEEDVKNGYKNGDLAFWTAGDDFVIFIEKEETSSEVGSVVNIGRITSDINIFSNFGNSFDVTIKLAN